MTVKELKAKIETLPENMEVFVAERKTDFTYGLVNSAHVMEINFSEEPDSKPLACDTVLVLDED